MIETSCTTEEPSVLDVIAEELDDEPIEFVVGLVRLHADKNVTAINSIINLFFISFISTPQKYYTLFNLSNKDI
jgi:hypothetical protein